MKILALSIGFTPKLERQLHEFMPARTGPESTIGICCNAYRFSLVRKIVFMRKARYFKRLGYRSVHVDMLRHTPLGPAAGAVTI